MANGNPILAKQIFNELDQEWFERWAAWKTERHAAKVPDSIVGSYSKD